MPGFKAYPSEGNFVLIDAHVLDKTSEEIRDAMTQKGIYIRPMGGHHMQKGFHSHYGRNHDQNKLFMKKFQEYVAEVLDR